MKYIRTNNGVIIDLEKFINNEKDTPYYTDFIFDEITKGGHLKWTAIGTDKNTMENQRGRRCQFDATLNSEIIKQADTIKELCDEFVDTSELKTTNTGGWLYDEFDSDNKCLVYYAEDERRTIPLNEFDLSKIYGAIWTDKGLIYVAKMNDKGELELL